MKKIFKVTALIAVLLFISYLAQAQPGPGVQSGSGPVLGGPIGGGAPVGSGTVILFALAGVYAAKKASRLKIKTAEKPA